MVRRRRVKRFGWLSSFVKAVPAPYIATLAVALFSGFGCQKLGQVEEKTTQMAVAQAASLGDANEVAARLQTLEALVRAQGAELRRLGGRVERGRRRTTALEVEAAKPRSGILEGAGRAVVGFLGWVSSPFRSQGG